VLKTDGSYVFISLLQDFIADFVYDFFAHSYEVRTYELIPKETGNMSYFMTQIKRSEKGAIYIHHLDGKVEKVTSSEAKQSIKKIQLETAFKDKIN